MKPRKLTDLLDVSMTSKTLSGIGASNQLEVEIYVNGNIDEKIALSEARFDSPRDREVTMNLIGTLIQQLKDEANKNGR